MRGLRVQQPDVNVTNMVAVIMVEFLLINTQTKWFSLKLCIRDVDSIIAISCATMNCFSQDSVWELHGGEHTATKGFSGTCVKDSSRQFLHRPHGRA